MLMQGAEMQDDERGWVRENSSDDEDCPVYGVRSGECFFS